MILEGLINLFLKLQVVSYNFLQYIYINLSIACGLKHDGKCIDFYEYKDSKKKRDTKKKLIKRKKRVLRMVGAMYSSFIHHINGIVR
jgi:hypothetical protein